MDVAIAMLLYAAPKNQEISRKHLSIAIKIHLNYSSLQESVQPTNNYPQDLSQNGVISRMYNIRM